MSDYLLHYDDEAKAAAALPGLHGDGGWTGDVLPVSLVEADPVFGEPDDEGMPVLIAERVTRPGFWLLASLPDLPGEVAAIERETGRIVEGDDGLAGLRLDPVWAGAEPLLSVMSIEPQPDPDPEPEDISDRQFAQILAIHDVITQAEAIAWAARGELPAAMEVALAELPEADQFPARMLLSSATTYQFSHPLGPKLGMILGITETERREFWRAAAAL